MNIFAPLLLTLLTCTSAHAQGDPQAGQALFAKTCGGCHSIGRSARAGFGPQLNGLFGRHAGGSEDYVYSSAMKSSSVVWNRETLTAFIKDPSDVVSGTRMSFWGISDSQQIDDLLSYLQANQDAK